MSQLFQLPPQVPAPDVSAEGLQAFYFECVPYQGKPTRVFAFLGIPAIPNGEKVPAMVLVHGGAGTASSEWVKLWNSRGYAAIAFDHGGHVPVRDGEAWSLNPESGPLLGNWQDVTKPVTDHWMFHAVAASILAHTILRNWSGVDPDRIGITGISLGAVVSCIVAALDTRLRLAALVYGCGFISGEDKDGTQFVGRETTMDVARWRELWDPSRFLPGLTIPTLWVSGTNDFAFTLRAWQLSYLASPAPRTLSLHVDMPHSQPAGQSAGEIFAFADHILRAGPKLAKILAHGCDHTVAWLEYESKFPVTNAELNFTRDKGPWQERKWETHSLNNPPQGGRVTMDLPSGATCYYWSLKDEQGLLVSSEHSCEEGQ